MNNPNDVCVIFNDYFTNVTLEIGSEEILNEDEHSIKYLKCIKITQVL